jgi:hypothetical protein
MELFTRIDLKLAHFMMFIVIILDIYLRKDLFNHSIQITENL